MVDSVAATTSFIGHHPLHYRWNFRDGSTKRISYPRFTSDIKGQRLNWSKKFRSNDRNHGRFFFAPIKALAMELTREAYSEEEERRIIRDWNHAFGVAVKKRGLWPPPNKADSPSLHNPLLRQERMGSGWLAVIFEWEGVIVEDDPEFEKQSWLTLSEEEGKSPPPAFILRRIEGMKTEHAISEVLCWSRDPTQLQRMASRKEEIYRGLQGGFYQVRSGSKEFVNTLINHNIPMALASTRPRNSIQSDVETVGMEGLFNVIVAAEDVFRGKPDPEMFVYAAQLLGFIPERCIVFGNSNQTVEAAHDARMKCVAVASKHPMYELGAADLVVRRLNELAVVDLKDLANIDLVGEEAEVELEEEEDPSPPTSVAVADLNW
ncbi:hypothetical protein QJS10_CPA06g00312 [Acorus calamus]|uniref:Uncharacterized protein n=1 Tax=Acorus calamus TaxID=4465 RepID=A0AAV9EK26_ACOCL|nr:hypothetical protein QJS10_CPA06g00312 [Acorus calamus]